MPPNSELEPWKKKPFELIFHAEVHYRRGDDYDRRLALISFDNSIEISITTYLTLHPIQRGDRQYDKKEVEKWLRNYHTKIDFFVSELQRRGLPEYKKKTEIIWYHDERNDQYHGKGSGVPEQLTLDGIREVALWIFSVLFDTSKIAQVLEESILESESPAILEDYVVPERPEKNIVEPDTNKLKALTVATLAGGWDESNEDDISILKRLTDGV